MQGSCDAGEGERAVLETGGTGAPVRKDKTARSIGIMPVWIQITSADWGLSECFPCHDGPINACMETWTEKRRWVYGIHLSFSPLHGATCGASVSPRRPPALSRRRNTSFLPPEARGRPAEPPALRDQWDTYVCITSWKGIPIFFYVI